MTRRHASLLQRLTPQSPQPLLEHPPPHSPTSLFPARDTRQSSVVGHSPPSPGHSPPRAALHSASEASLEHSGRRSMGNASVPSASSVTDMVRSWAVGSKDADKLLEWAKLYEQRRASPSDLAASGDMQAHQVPSLFPPGSHSLFPRQLPPDRGSGSPPERDAGQAHSTSGWAIVRPSGGSSMSMSPPESAASTHRKLGLDSRVDTGDAASSPAFPRGPTQLSGQQPHEHHHHHHQQQQGQGPGATHMSSPRETVLLKSQSGRIEASFELSPRYLPLSSPTLSHGSEPQEPGDLAPIDHMDFYEDNR